MKTLHLSRESFQMQLERIILSSVQMIVCETNKGEKIKSVRKALKASRA